MELVGLWRYGPRWSTGRAKGLAEKGPSVDKRRRFNNDFSFLVGNKHLNIVTVIDHGVARAGAIEGPCNVMRDIRS